MLRKRTESTGARINIFSNIMRGKRKRESDAAEDAGVYKVHIFPRGVTDPFHFDMNLDPDPAPNPT